MTRENWIRVVLAELRRQKHAGSWGVPYLGEYNETQESLIVDGEVSIGGLVTAILQAIHATREKRSE